MAWNSSSWVASTHVAAEKKKIFTIYVLDSSFIEWIECNHSKCYTIAIWLTDRTTDAQWSLFSLKSKTFGLRQTNWSDKFWAFGVFLAKLSAPSLVQWVPCPLFNHYFYKKLRLYIHIPNIYLGLGFKFGLQRIRNLAFVCP